MAEIPLDIMDTIRGLQDRLRFLEGRAQIRPAMTQIAGGDVSVSAGGRLIVTTPTGNQILYIGKQSPPHADGSDQQGFIVRREDNSVAMSVWTAAGTGAQAVQLWDSSGNVVVSDDITAAAGLARPYLEGASWFGGTESPTYTTNSASFVTLMHSPWIKQHPRLNAYYLVKADAGTTGEIRLIDDSSNVIGPVISIASGSFFFGSTIGTVAGGHESQFYLHWQARTTGGSGSIGVKGLATYGVQS